MAWNQTDRWSVVQVAGRRSQVAGRRSQVAGRRSEVAGDFWSHLRQRLVAHGVTPDTEDDVQEALLAVMRRFGATPAIPVSRAVAYARASQQRLRATRLRRRRPHLLGEMDGLLVAPGSVSVDGPTAERRQFLAQFLTPRAVEIVEARLDGLGVKATARRLGTSPSAVRRVLARWQQTVPALARILGESATSDPPLGE